MKTKKRIYKVVVQEGGNARTFLVRAVTAFQAVNHVAKGLIVATVATQDELVEGVQTGMVVQNAGPEGEQLSLPIQEVSSDGK